MTKSNPSRALGIARRRPVQTLREATFDPALYDALEAFIGYAPSDAAVLIGTLATNFYTKPRHAIEAEFLVRGLPVDLRDVFEYQEGQSIIHVPSGARLEFVTPGMLNLPTEIAEIIFATATLRNGLLVASREAIIALNLIKADDPRAHHECLANVVSILGHGDVDLDGWCLDQDHLALLMQCRAASVSPI